MSSGGGFGGSYLAEQLLKKKRRRMTGELANYLDWAHHERVYGSFEKRTRRAAAMGQRPPIPPEPPRAWERG